MALAETVGTRLRKDKVKAEVIAVGIKNSEFVCNTHQCIMGAVTNITTDIHSAACRLFEESWDGAPIRHLGIHASRIRD